MRWTRVVVLPTTALLGLGGVVAASHGRSAHAGEHFVSGHVDSRDIVVRIAPRREAGTSKGFVWSDTCAFHGGIAHVPVHVAVHAPGAVTLHITATVSNRRTGDDTVASATQDLAVDASVAGEWLRIPLDEALWRDGANNCAVTGWTMTPGAWFPDDD